MILCDFRPARGAGFSFLHAHARLSGSLDIVLRLPDIRLFDGLWRQAGSLCGDSTFAGKVRNMIYYIRKMTFWIRIFLQERVKVK